MTETLKEPKAFVESEKGLGVSDLSYFRAQLLMTFARAVLDSDYPLFQDFVKNKGIHINVFLGSEDGENYKFVWSATSMKPEFRKEQLTAIAEHNLQKYQGARKNEP